MKTTGAKPVYHRLIVAAKRDTAIWLIDDSWHPVQKAVGRLDTSVLPGCYFVELGEPGLRGVAYPIDLFSDLELGQEALEAAPSCSRQAPKFLDE